MSATLHTVSAMLHNTPAVCRKSYVHPLVLDSFGDGTLAERWASASARGSRFLTTAERKVLRILEVAAGDRDGQPTDSQLKESTWSYARR